MLVVPRGRLELEREGLVGYTLDLGGSRGEGVL